MNPQASPLLPGPHLKSPLTQWDPLDVPLDPGQLTTRNVAWGIADFCIVYPWSCIIVTLSNAMTCNHHQALVIVGLVGWFLMIFFHLF